jgi:uncharacterized tellurite resistance protein B-like protein
MVKDAFEARRRTFEEEYFRKKDDQLVDKLRAVFQKNVDKESLRQTTGVTDERLLDNLVALDLSGELMSAFVLYPLVEIAWADGHVHEREVQAVLAAAESRGVMPGSAPYALLEEALKNGPRAGARDVWYSYATELRKMLSAQELKTFRDALLDSARRVAEASGGMLNLAFTVSGNEKKVLDAMERALTSQ